MSRPNFLSDTHLKRLITRSRKLFESHHIVGLRKADKSTGIRSPVNDYYSYAKFCAQRIIPKATQPNPDRGN